MFLRRWWILRDGWHTHTQPTQACFDAAVVAIPGARHGQKPQQQVSRHMPLTTNGNWDLLARIKNEKPCLEQEFHDECLDCVAQTARATHRACSQSIPWNPCVASWPGSFSWRSLPSAFLAIFLQWWEDGGIHNVETKFSFDKVASHRYKLWFHWVGFISAYLFPSFDWSVVDPQPHLACWSSPCSSFLVIWPMKTAFGVTSTCSMFNIFVVFLHIEIMFQCAALKIHHLIFLPIIYNWNQIRQGLAWPSQQMPRIRRCFVKEGSTFGNCKQYIPISWGFKSIKCSFHMHKLQNVHTFMFFWQTGGDVAHVVGWLVRFPPATHKMFHHSAIAIVFLGSGTTGTWLFGKFWVQCGAFCSKWWDTVLQTNMGLENQWLGWILILGRLMFRGYVGFRGLSFSKTTYDIYNIFEPEGFQVFQNKRERASVCSMNTVLFLFVLTFCYFILMYPIFLSISIPGFISFKKNGSLKTKRSNQSLWIILVQSVTWPRDPPNIRSKNALVDNQSKQRWFL